MFHLLQPRRSAATGATFSLVAIWLTGAASTFGQVESARRDVDLVVDGLVQGVFRNETQRVVQILVQRSDAPGLTRAGGRFPAPGEYVYVHLGDPSENVGRRPRRSTASNLPQASVRLRAFLKIDQQGQWTAAGSRWFEENPGQIVERPEDLPTGRSDRSLGVTAERVALGGGSGLKVVRVAPNSPAANAGVEPGDILVKANGEAISSPRQLAAAYRQQYQDFALTVRDVRTGREVLVPIEPADAPQGRPTAPAARAVRPLGAETELAFYDGKAALKVTNVAPNSPAQRAGIAVGMLILKADGQPTAEPEQLREVERASRGLLELQVVDPSDRRERTVRVTL